MILGALVLVGLLSPLSIQDPQERADAVASLLAERCAGCHRPGSDKPKATQHWADAKDLARTAKNADLILAGDPESSDLFLAISFEDMPPPDSGVAPLSEDEKALIEAWIRNGARVPASAPTAAGNSNPDAGSQGGVVSSLTRWVSHFHPMIVHFPIALLVAALIAEFLGRMLNNPGMRTTANFCLTLGALSALPSAGLGWLLAEHTSHHGSVLLWHRWLGVSTAMLASVTLWAAHKRPRLRLPLLLAIAAMVSLTGHLGGVLSFGGDWLQWPG